MVCRKCGQQNPSGMRACGYCGYPFLSVNGNEKIEQKRKTQNIIVALVLLLGVLATAVVCFVVIRQPQLFSDGGFTAGGGGGGGGGTTFVVPERSGSDTEDREDSGENAPPPIERAPEEREPMEEVLEEYPARPRESEEMEGQAFNQVQRERDVRAQSRDEARREYLRRAGEIERYEEDYVITAESQMELNIESSILYEMWDTLLNDIYQYLQEILPENEFADLQQEELAWISQKEETIEQEGAAWEGGSGESMARALTGAYITQDRCYELIEYIP